MIGEDRVDQRTTDVLHRNTGGRMIGEDRVDQRTTDVLHRSTVTA